MVSNVQSCGPSDLASIAISFMHSECLPFLQNQQILSVLPPTEHESIIVIGIISKKTL